MTVKAILEKQDRLLHVIIEEMEQELEEIRIKLQAYRSLQSDFTAIKESNNG